MKKEVKRAYSVSEILERDIPKMPFEGNWKSAMGTPAFTGVWIVWGHSANGKTSFVMQLAKYLCKFGKVLYNSLEESELSIQMSLKRHRMIEVNKRFTILEKMNMSELSEKLLKRKSANFVIIDSFQYSGLTYNTYKEFKAKHSNKLLIFVSHAQGDEPKGAAAKSVEFDADVKIAVRGFRAICKSRFMEESGEPFIIWAEGAAKCWAK